MCKALGKITSLILAMMISAILSACTAGPIVHVGTPTRLSTAKPTPTAVKLELAQAREMIKDWLAKEVPGFNMDSLKELQETDFGIDKLFEETGSQYFTLNSSSYGIVNGKVFSLGFFALLSAVNADVDNDGRYETVLLVDTGSGRYIQQLYVLKEGVLYKHLIENSGAQQEYRLDKIGLNRVELLKMVYDNGESGHEENLGSVALQNGLIIIDKFNNEDTRVETTWLEAMPKGIPEPPGVKQYVQTRWGLECWGLSETDFFTYKKIHNQAGFEQTLGFKDFSLTYHYDDRMVLINNQSYLGMSNNSIIVDIDNDGKYELLCIAGYGSGVYHLDLTVYKEGEIYAQNSWGFEMALERIDDHTVKLRGFRYVGSKIVYVEYMGKLSIREAGGKRIVEPEIEPEYVFSQEFIDRQLP